MCAHSIKSIFDIWMSEDTREDTFLFRISRIGYAKWSSSFAIFFAYLHLQWAEFVDHVPKKELLEFCQCSVKGRNAKTSFLAIWGTMTFSWICLREWNLTCKINGEENWNMIFWNENENWYTFQFRQQEFKRKFNKRYNHFRFFTHS